jgi:hypothetical protein
MTSMERSERDRSLAAAVPEAQDPLPAPVEPAGSTHRRRLRHRTWLAAIAGVLILPIAVAAGLTYAAAGPGGAADAADAAAARVVTAADLEQDYGIKVQLVAVIASGGMIDLRYTVTDKEKATHLLHDAAEMPALFVESSGALIRMPTGMRHKTVLMDGGNYFILYPNPGGVIQAGTPVSVVIDGVRLEPLDAQS